MIYEFLVDYAVDKDTLGTVAGTAHVAVDSDDEVDARLMAEQLVAAVGLEPVAVRSPGFGDAIIRGIEYSGPEVVRDAYETIGRLLVDALADGRSG